MKTFNARFGAWALLLPLLASPFATVLPAQTFTNVTAVVGLPQIGSSSVSWGDYDNDGRLDLLAGAGIFRNTESGFTNVTGSIAPGLPGMLSGISTWADYDSDGRVDFIIVGYRHFGSNYYAFVSEIWRNTVSGFTNVTATVAPGLPGLWHSAVAWGDYDNDGRLDLLITGSFVSQIWRNTGSHFVNVTATVAPGLPGVKDGAVAWGDYDNDGRLDFIITGGIPRRSDLDDNYPYYNPLSQIWRNTGSGFVNVTATVAPGLPATYWSSVAWGDYDNDGRIDLLITGYGSGSQILRNTENGFVNVTASIAGILPSVIQGPAAWGDYDNDGRLDILLSGYLYRNTGSGFIKATATDAPSLSKVVSSSLAWGDYNSDGRLDFLLTGSTYFNCDGCDTPPTVFQLWQNNVLQTNPPPTVITKVPSNASENSLVLSADINPHGQTTTVWFTWGDSTNYGQVTAVQAMVNGNSLTDFSQTITGLGTGVTYYYRAVGSNDQGQVAFGVAQRFLLAPPGVTTSPIGNFRPNTATIKGQVTPNNLPTYGWFEWGLTPALDQMTPVQFLGNGFDATLSQDLFGITIGTPFHFRAVVSNSLGVAYGAVQSLVMIDAPLVCPIVSLSPSSKSVNYAGGAGYSVHAVIGCPWIVINSNSWITITSATNSATVESTLTFNVATNTSPQPRSGNITIAGRNFLVSQAGNNAAPPDTNAPPGNTNAPCTYSIYPADVNHGYGAATNIVFVNAPTNCAWNVANSNLWITILSGASGMGYSQVVYAVEANPGGPARSGNITIGGRNYAVTQAARYVSPPADQSVVLGGTVTFSATAHVTPPFTYQWLFNGVALVDGNGVSGATTSTLMLTGVQYWQAGNYRLVVKNSSSTNTSSSATLTVAPVSNALPLAEALDTGNMFLWKTDANSPGSWFGQTNTTHDGVDAAECSGLAPGARAYLQVKSGGPGLLSFWWKTAFATPSDSLLFYIFGVDSVTVTNTTDWEQRTFIVPPGNVDLGWGFWNSSTGEQSKAWLDQVQFTPCDFNLSGSAGWISSGGGTGSVTLSAAAYCPWDVVNTNSWITILSGITNYGSGPVTYAVARNPTAAQRSGTIVIAEQSFIITQSGNSLTNAGISLVEALDTAGSLEWNTIGTPEWFGQAVMSRDGTDAAQSGPISHSTAATATTTVNGPGTVFFWWKVSSETNKDYLKFFINGVQQTRISGEVDWHLLSYNLFSGTNTLKWTYSKNAGVTSGQDRGWLDQVQFIPTPETGLCAVAVSPISAAHSASPGTGSVSVVVAPGCAWDVVNTNAWITYVASPGFVRYTVSTNNSREQRTGVIFIGGRPFTVTQANGLPPCVYSLSSTGFTQPNYESQGYFFVMAPAGCPWNVFNTNTWITIISGLSGSGNGSVNYLVSQNTSATRSGQIHVAGQTFTVTQPGTSMTMAEALDTVGTPLAWNNHWSYPWIGQGNITHDGVDAAQSGAMADNGSTTLSTLVNGPGTFSFWWKVSSETNYDSLRLYMSGVEVAKISGEVDWQQRTVTLPVGTRTIYWSYSKDSSMTAGQDRGWVDQVQFIPISGCPATLSSTNATHPSNSSTGLVNIAIASHCPWGVYNPYSWISISSGLNTTGNGTVTYTVADNPTAYTRIGYVQIADQTLVITQLGIAIPPANCSYTVSPNGFGPGSDAGFTGTVFINTPSSCEWNVLNTNAWITITSSLTNFGSGQATFSVSQNPAPFARSGQFLVAGRAITVSQSAAPFPCLVTISPGSASHSSSSSTGLINVAAAPDCTWVVFNTNSWISIESGTSGTGNGSVSYAVAANPAAAGRTGYIQIANRVFPVMQAGDPSTCTISISPTNRSHGYGAASNSVNVSTQAGCAWNVVNTNSWISFASNSNSGSGAVLYSVARNTNIQARSGIVIIGGKTLLLTQAGGPSLRFLRGTNSNTTLSVHGDAGKLYVVECSEDLIHWIPISTNSASSTVTNAPVGNAPRRFYRTVEMP